MLLAVGFIPSLLYIVQSGEGERREEALAVLRDVALNLENHLALVQAGSISAMVDVLSSGGTIQASIFAASCLRSLALHEQYAREVGYDCHQHTSMEFHLSFPIKPIEFCSDVVTTSALIFVQSLPCLSKSISFSEGAGWGR